MGCGGHPGNHRAVVGGRCGERGVVVANMGASGRAIVVRGHLDYKSYGFIRLHR